MKNAFRRTFVTILIIALSIGIGIGYDRLRDYIDRKLYPRDYSEFVTRYAAEYGVPESIVYAVIKVESDFESNALSHAGAVGLMQLMPDTFVWLSEKLGDGYDAGMLYDPETNIRYGVYYLSSLYREFALWNSVYAAYNAGPTRVREWSADPRYADENGALVSIPFEETRNYVARVEEAVELYETLYGDAPSEAVNFFTKIKE